MKYQKFFLKSKTIWGAVLTLLIAIAPLLLEGVEQGFTNEHVGSIIALAVSTLWTIYSRYIAQGNLYTPYGFPGRSYISSRGDY